MDSFWWKHVEHHIAVEACNDGISSLPYWAIAAQFSQVERDKRPAKFLLNLE
jgi:hypothetical protein